MCSDGLCTREPQVCCLSSRDFLPAGTALLHNFCEQIGPWGDCSCYTACALLLFGKGCPGLCDQRHSKALGDFISLIYIAHYSSVCVVSRRNMILSGVLKPSAHSSLLALRVTGCLSARSAGLLNDHIPTLCKC